MKIQKQFIYIYTYIYIYIYIIIKMEISLKSLHSTKTEISRIFLYLLKLEIFRKIVLIFI